MGLSSTESGKHSKLGTLLLPPYHSRKLTHLVVVTI